MTLEKTYSTTAGDDSILDWDIAYTRMLMINREGMVMDIIISNSDVAITNRQALYKPAYGTIKFNTEFNPNETINIVYGTYF